MNKSLIEEMIEGYIASSARDLKSVKDADNALMDGLEVEAW